MVILHAGRRIPGADDETRTRDPHLGKVMRYQLRYIRVRTHRKGELTVRDTGIEPVTPSVSGKCSTAELIARSSKIRVERMTRLELATLTLAR